MHEDFHKLADIQPTLVLLSDDLVYVGRSLDLSPHRVVATTIAIALERPFEIAIGVAAPCCRRNFAVIPANTIHHLRADGAMVFIYTGSVDSSRVIDCRQEVRTLACRIGGPGSIAPDIITSTTSLLAMFPIVRSQISPGVAKALSATADSPYDINSADIAAGIAGLQTQAFRRLVRHQTGLTYGQHQMRARINVAIRSLACGQSLTTAAHDSGYSSSSHLSATVRRMFGLTASTLKSTGVRIVI